MANKIDIEKVKILFEKGDIDSQIEAYLRRSINDAPDIKEIFKRISEVEEKINQLSETVLEELNNN